jgi:hypothetical protein
MRFLGVRVLAVVIEFDFLTTWGGEYSEREPRLRHQSGLDLVKSQVQDC